MKNKPNLTIEHNGMKLELISGPWKSSEQALMDQHIKTMQQGGIKVVIQSRGKDVYIYRDSIGFKHAPQTPQYNEKNLRIPWKPTPFRQFLKEWTPRLIGGGNVRGKIGTSTGAY